MINDNYWGKSPWTYNELHNATIECAWIDDSVRWIGIGTIHAKERPNGDQKIEVICDDFDHAVRRLKIVNIPPRYRKVIERRPEVAALVKALGGVRQ